jgi:hypothetical protein
LTTSRQGGLTEVDGVSSVLVKVLTGGASLDLVETVSTGKVASTQVIQQVASISTSRASRILASIRQSGGTDTSGGVEEGSSLALLSRVESVVTCVVLRAEVVDKEHSITLVTSWVLTSIWYSCLTGFGNDVVILIVGAPKSGVESVITLKVSTASVVNQVESIVDIGATGISATNRQLSGACVGVGVEV